MRPWPHGDPGVVVRDVLAGAAYRHAPVTHAKPPDPSLWQTLWAWFLDHVLRPIFGPIGQALGSASGSRVGVLLVVLAMLAVLALVAFAVYRLVAKFERATRARSGPPGRATSLGSPRDATTWRAIAADAAARGEYARAIAALFAAALAVLDERAVVRFDPARTPGEYRRAVRLERASAADDFDELARRFVFAAYASDRSDADAFAQAERAFERFEAFGPIQPAARA